jgi:hypothetical protein
MPKTAGRNQGVVVVGKHAVDRIAQRRDREVRNADAAKDRMIEAKVPRQQMGVWTWCRRTIPIQQPPLVGNGCEEFA